MELSEFVDQVESFDKLPPREKIKLFGWYLHTQEKKEHFHADHIRACYKKLHLVPGEVGTYLMRMASYDTPDLVRERQGFKLTRPIRSQLDKKHGEHTSVIAVKALLADLPGKIPDIAEKTFLVETLNCYKVEAYRACMVMMWNLAYAHFLDWILKNPQRLADFNTAIPKRYPSLKNVHVTKYDDFRDELKESKVVDIASSAGLINDDLYKLLKAKLDRRNTAAHPSILIVQQPQADDMISDLVNNVILTLN